MLRHVLDHHPLCIETRLATVVPVTGNFADNLLNTIFERRIDHSQGIPAGSHNLRNQAMLYLIAGNSEHLITL